MLARRLLARRLSAVRARTLATTTLHTNQGTPSPDAVHMYLEEANATSLVAFEQINIGKADNRSAEFLKINPMGELPALAIPDGTVLTESMAICKYLDAALLENTPLVGVTAAERAMTDAWIGRVDSKYLTYLILAFRNGPMFKFFQPRIPEYLNAAVAEPMGTMAQSGLGWLDQTLSDGRPFLGGDRFTIADIRLYTYYKFVTAVFKAQAAPAERTHFLAYIKRIGERDSAKAIVAQAAALRRKK